MIIKWIYDGKLFGFLNHIMHIVRSSSIRQAMLAPKPFAARINGVHDEETVMFSLNRNITNVIDSVWKLMKESDPLRNKELPPS